MNVAWAILWGGSRSTKTLCFFRVKWPAAGDERYLVCATGAAGVILCANRSSYVFLQENGLFLCTSFYAFLEAVVADRIGMAA